MRSLPASRSNTVREFCLPYIPAKSGIISKTVGRSEANESLFNNIEHTHKDGIISSGYDVSSGADE
jgi:hypothetical protein